MNLERVPIPQERDTLQDHGRPSSAAARWEQRMARHDEDDAKVLQLGRPAAQGEELPYRVELWMGGQSETLERVLARALNAALARAIFRAAQTEYPDRRITLRRGSRVIADTRGD